MAVGRLRKLERAPIKWRAFLAQCRQAGIGKEAARDAWVYMARCEHYVDDTYHVAIDRRPDHGFPFPLVHLSIKRHDRVAMHDWRDLQEIKNQMVGVDAEAIELYPAESRVVDTANQYHLWAFPNGHRVPVGWTTRHVTDHPNFGAAKQRPRSGQPADAASSG